ncbi:1-aminocyclopropane-1-carboxylate deaminase [Cysteiniphilum halobium]|uniref:1-aminocyclopropane-1-carboxylate deaminase n=1 Tax=Cysteiniphilum halobium TaxID=2219059 RepID=UPI000E657802|nr:1-aminocyclopropane-1-carboxylate deaminase [Cysteiniphilum halobium]
MPFIIKRDDLIHPIFSGNKAYKLYWLIEHIKHNPHIKKVASYGGAQSNYMLALAQFCSLNKLAFDYWLKPLSKTLKNTPHGNYKEALALGMQSCFLDQELSLANIKSHYKEDAGILILAQGGADARAEEGMKLCAQEINAYLKQHNITQASVVIASGTGISALYLQQHVDKIYQVYTVPCVGDKAYLYKQMVAFSQGKWRLPKIISPLKKYYFGHCYPEYLAMYYKLKKQTNIEFDLLYDPLTWQVMFEHYDALPKPIIYLHCGGASGNISMLKRYYRLGAKSLSVIE